MKLESVLNWSILYPSMVRCFVQGAKTWGCRLKEACPGICICSSPVTERQRLKSQCGSVAGLTLPAGDLADPCGADDLSNTKLGH